MKSEITSGIINGKKNIILKICLLTTFCLQISCEKFVDIKASSAVSLIQTANDCQLLLNDYINMNTEYPSDGEASADDYFLLGTSDYLSTSLTNTDRDLYIWSPTAIQELALPQWQQPYHVVYLSNLIMENIEKLKGTSSQAVLDDMRGQALFFRAYAFWEVAQLYAKPYSSSTADSDPGIPLRLQSDINGKSVRGTVQQTYNQIINDLQQASEILANSSVVASRPNKVSAYSMLARVYLSMEDYPNALVNSTKALQINSQLIDYNTISTTSSTPFTRFNKEVIFQSLTTAGGSLIPNSASDNIAKVDPVLVSSYASNDLRGKIFFKANSGVNINTVRFTGNYEPVTSSNLFNGLAVDEIYLTRAECYARSGNITSAMADLNTLLRTRWVTGTYIDLTATTADDALAKVIIERRKELVMRGMRWTDLRRLNKDQRFAKTLSRTILGASYTLPPNDLRYTLLIPREVVTISKIQQNPR